MIRKLTSEDLINRCSPEVFSLNPDAETSSKCSIIGQDRALNALSFGLAINGKGFNIYALGENGTGKVSTVMSLLEEKSAMRPVPADWCYVYNFKDPDSPIAVSLYAGMATAFQKDMEGLVKMLRFEVPKVFESKDYEKQRGRFIEAFQTRQKELFQEIERDAESMRFSIRKGQSSLVIVPMKEDGEPLTEEEFNALSEDVRKDIEKNGRSLQERLDDVVRAVRAEERRLKDAFSTLDREVVVNAIGYLFDALLDKYRDIEKVVSYLKDVMEDVLSHIEDFKPIEDNPPQIPFLKPQRQETNLVRYSVNVLVNNSDLKGAPVIVENNPTYPNLCGRIEHRFQYGMAVTDFSMIKSGALHRANGGYLIINALELLKNIFSYDMLKRAIRTHEIRIEDVWEQYRLVNSSSLRPEPIPLNVKVILTGSIYLYYMLYNLDEEFKELFKVKADFDSQMPRNPETILLYGHFATSCQRRDNLRPLQPDALCRIVEAGSRIAGHKGKLSTRFSDIADLIRESDYRASVQGSQSIGAEHVEQAIKERIYRSNRIQERLQELIEEDTIIIDSSGMKAGQVNGLAILDMGDYMFGKPSRITARAYPGKAGIINIERETKMSGKIHNKAVMTITSYLGSKFISTKPLSLSAYIAFEQLYEMVEGDSAACAEMYALLSSISGIPLRQSIAVTGSMDQNGDVQPVGGINEKIEGFFNVCKARGLEGGQGVIIPSRNIKHLMLREDVIDAVSKGMFRIFTIDRVEEGIEILADMKAGEMGADGRYEEGTLYGVVQKRLEEFASAFEKDRNKEDGQDKGTDRQTG